jgi:hypothetical protein
MVPEAERLIQEVTPGWFVVNFQVVAGDAFAPESAARFRVEGKGRPATALKLPENCVNTTWKSNAPFHTFGVPEVESVTLTNKIPGDGPNC